MKRLAIILPGIGYTADRPLLHFAMKLAAGAGYDVSAVKFGEMPSRVKGDEKKKRKAFAIAMKAAREQVRQKTLKEYDEVVFISKSLGSVVALSLAQEYGIRPKQVIYTPVDETFAAWKDPTDCVMFHGLADPWMPNDRMDAFAAEHGCRLYTYPDANHSIETGDVQRDLRFLEDIMKKTAEYLAVE